MCWWNMISPAVAVPKSSADRLELVRESDFIKLISSYGLTKKLPLP